MAKAIFRTKRSLAAENQALRARKAELERLLVWILDQLAQERYAGAELARLEKEMTETADDPFPFPLLRRSSTGRPS